MLKANISALQANTRALMDETRMLKAMALQDENRTLKVNISVLQDDLDTCKKENTKLKAKIKKAVDTAFGMGLELEEP